MADIGKTDAQWLRLLGAEKAKAFLAPMRLLREVEDRFHRSRQQYRVWIDPAEALKTSHANPVTLSGVDIGTNTDKDGTLYVRITGAGPYAVALYKATGGGSGDKVCEDTSVAADAEATLVAANSSGVTGTYQMPASVTVTTGDELRVQVVQDYRLAAADSFPADGTVEDDSYSRNAAEDGYAQAANAIRGAKAAIARALGRWALAAADNPVARGNAFLESNEVALVTATPVTDSSGNVSITRGGFFERSKAAMTDETTGSTQTVLKRTVSAAAGSFASSNDGAGAVASHTPLERMPASRATFRCVQGADTGALGSETFDGFIYLQNGEDRQIPLSGLQVGKQWSHPLGLGPITLTRTLAKTNDGSNNVFAATTGCTVTGENNANTDSGVLYAGIVANGSNWDISFYSSSTQSSASLVSKATNVAASTAFTTSAQNGSGLVITWTTGGTVSAVTNITLSLQPFYVENTNNVADEFEIVTTVTTEGLIQTIVAEEFGGQLNSAASSETISDGYAKASTFMEFLPADN